MMRILFDAKWVLNLWIVGNEDIIIYSEDFACGKNEKFFFFV